jgi:hypothetical protein
VSTLKNTVSDVSSLRFRARSDLTKSYSSLHRLHFGGAIEFEGRSLLIKGTLAFSSILELIYELTWCSSCISLLPWSFLRLHPVFVPLLHHGRNTCIAGPEVRPDHLVFLVRAVEMLIFVVCHCETCRIERLGRRADGEMTIEDDEEQREYVERSLCDREFPSMFCSSSRKAASSSWRGRNIPRYFRYGKREVRVDGRARERSSHEPQSDK